MLPGLRHIALCVLSSMVDASEAQSALQEVSYCPGRAKATIKHRKNSSEEQQHSHSDPKPRTVQTAVQHSSRLALSLPLSRLSETCTGRVSMQSGRAAR